MTEFFQIFFGFIGNITSILDIYSFDMFGFNVSIWSILLVFIIIGMVANVWWKGAKG